MSPDMAQKEIALISFIGNLENIGDIVDKNLMELARKKLYQGRRFSEEGDAELTEFHGMVSKNLERAIAAFAGSRPGPRPGSAGPASDHPPEGAGAARVAPEPACAAGSPSRWRPRRSTSTCSPTSSASPRT